MVIENQAVDEWVAECNSHIGEIKIPQYGIYPYPADGPYCTLENKWTTPDTIRHYADAMGDRNPLWRDEAYAANTMWGGIIAPPTYMDSIAWYALRWAQTYNQVAGAPFKVMSLPSGLAREWHQVIRPGDTFKVYDKYVGLAERKSRTPRPYRLFIDTVRRFYINQREETVATADVLASIQVLPQTYTVEEGQGAFKEGGRKRHRFSDEERDAIIRGYEEEKIRGANTLFWEDVNVGDTIKTLVVGPISVWDTVAFFAAIPAHAAAFDIEWERMKNNPTASWLNPETNCWECPGEGHICDNMGDAIPFSGGHAFAFGSHIDGLICRAMCNWMGDNGFLKRLGTQYRIIPILGDACIIRGTVTNKSIEDGEHLVDLQVNCENQDGLIIVLGTATVRLFSRT